MIPGLRRSPGEGNSYPFQYSGLKNFIDCMYSPWGCKESDMTKQLSLSQASFCLSLYTCYSPCLKHSFPLATLKVNSLQCRSRLKCYLLRVLTWLHYLYIGSLTFSFLDSFIFLHDPDHYFTFYYTFNSFL